jgi:NDP-sugar pyrophosphorylase family protein
MMDALLPVVILAGGLATRMQPMTQFIPKSLLPIDGIPFIVHQLQLLKQFGVTKVILCVGYKGDMIEQSIGNGHHLGLSVAYAYDGEVLKGTGGAILKALPMIEQNEFFVLYGDSYLMCDYRDIQKHFYQQNKNGLMTVFHNAGMWDASNVEYCESCIIRYDKVNKTSSMTHIDYGLGVMSKRAFEDFNHDDVFDLSKVYQNLLRNNELGAYEVKNRFYEVGSPDGYREFSDYMEKLNKEETCIS